MIRRTVQARLYAPLRVLVYASDATTRQRVCDALGSLPDTNTPSVDFVLAATHAAVIDAMASGTIDLAVLDGEATPSGGMGLTKQLKDELLQCPPLIVITARDDDWWLARWSRADAVVPRPIDPIVLRESCVPLLRGRLAV